MLRSELLFGMGIAVAASLAATASGCGGDPSGAAPDAGDTSIDAPRDDAALAGDAPDALDAPDAPDTGSTQWAPTWQRFIPGVGAFHAITAAGDRVVISAARVDTPSAGSLVIAEGQPGQITLTDRAQSAVLWLDDTGAVIAGRVLAERTSATIGGATSHLIETDHAGGVVVGGYLVGQMRFLPGTSAARVESALAPSVSSVAEDPFAIRFDAAASPTAFARGTTTTLASANSNRFTGLASLPGGDTLVVGLRESSTFALAGTALPAGTAAYVARIAPNGQVAWLRPHTGAGFLQHLHASAAGAVYLDASITAGATLFAGTPSAFAIPSVAGSSQLVIARVDADGSLAWARRVVPNQYSWIRTQPLADGGVLATIATNDAAAFELRDPANTLVTSGTSLARGTLLLRFSADGSLAFTKLIPWRLDTVVELGDGRLAGLASWYTNASPPEAPFVTLPPDIDPAEHPVYALQILSATGEDLALGIAGINPYTIATAAGQNSVVLATQSQPLQYVVDATGAFVAAPACEREQCLFVASYAIP